MQKIETAKLFKNGNSQAVRLPKKYRFQGDEVLIYRDGSRVVIEEKSHIWDDFFADKTPVPARFMSKRDRRPAQKRDLF